MSYHVLPSLTEPYQVLPSLTKSYRVLPNLPEFYRAGWAGWAGWLVWLAVTSCTFNVSRMTPCFCQRPLLLNRWRKGPICSCLAYDCFVANISEQNVDIGSARAPSNVQDDPFFAVGGPSPKRMEKRARMPTFGI